MARQRKIPAEKYIRNKRFLSIVERKGMPNRDLFSSENAKKILLRTYGYDMLYTDEGNMLSLSECSIPRISHAFNQTLKNAEKQVGKYEEKAVQGTDASMLVRLVGLLEAENRLAGDDLIAAMERTGIVMDSASPWVLSVLSREYGQDVIGSYYRE